MDRGSFYHAGAPQYAACFDDAAEIIFCTSLACFMWRCDSSKEFFSLQEYDLKIIHSYLNLVTITFAFLLFSVILFFGSPGILKYFSSFIYIWWIFILLVTNSFLFLLHKSQTQ